MLSLTVKVSKKEVVCTLQEVYRDFHAHVSNAKPLHGLAVMNSGERNKMKSDVEKKNLHTSSHYGTTRIKKETGVINTHIKYQILPREVRRMAKR